MRISFRGSDKGSALFISVALILVLSLLFLSVVPYIISMEKNAGIYKDRVLRGVIDENREIMREHDLH
jgi:Tfp pilus assembly protein PilX